MINGFSIFFVLSKTVLNFALYFRLSIDWILTFFIFNGFLLINWCEFYGADSFAVGVEFVVAAMDVFVEVLLEEMVHYFIFSV